MQIKIALPKGSLLGKTSALLQKADWELDEYHEKARFYHCRSQKFPTLLGKVFQEKDIPIQVAVGNYDLGICGLDWIEELLAKYPSSALVKVKNLGYGEGVLYVADGTSLAAESTLAQVKDRDDAIRIVSEYPNLAEYFALSNRLSRFNIFPVWGAAEVYPPESADLALIAVRTAAKLYDCGMVPVSKMLDFSAYLIANRNSWESKDLGEIVASICDQLLAGRKPASSADVVRPEMTKRYPAGEAFEDVVRLALPDGHQQQPTVNLLEKAGIKIDDYPSATGNRRPGSNLEGIMVKVIRPQDMPLQVANRHFDLAVTGKDWLAEHLGQFPSSPVKELLDLKYGGVRIVAVVSQGMLVDDIYELRKLIAERSAPFRIASEYVNIADKYARDNHLGSYRMIPTWGASEAFLPDDADLLIENTQTGRTIASHKLKIIDTLFESTACLVGNTTNTFSPAKSKRIKSIIEKLRAVVEVT